MNLENVNFLDCEVGVRNDGYRIYWNGGQIDRSAPPGSGVTELATYTGIFGMGQQGISYFQDVGVHLSRTNPINPAPTGVDLVGMHLHGSGRNYLYKSGLNSGDFGVYSNQHGIYSWCSNYVDNVKQFALGAKSTLAMAGNRWNRVEYGVFPSPFTKDYISILGYGGTKIVFT